MITSRAIRARTFAVALTVALCGCADAPKGPYAYHDYSDTFRMGGDFKEMVAYTPGKASPTLRPPTLVYPPDRSVFSHYPRELVYQWNPAPGTPKGAEYLFEYDFTTGHEEQFGDWTKSPDPMFAYRTAKASLDDRFVGAQPGRWRVKAIDGTGETDWSSWRYFRFTQ